MVIDLFGYGSLYQTKNTKSYDSIILQSSIQADQR